MVLKSSLLPAVILLTGVFSLKAQTQPEPRLSVSQVGLHFICTADGQPDMYSWRLPVKDPNSSKMGDYIIPVIADQDLEANAQGAMPVVSGGRTALRLEEDPSLGSLKIAHEYPPGFDGGNAHLTNLGAVHWTSPSQDSLMIKRRYYSNYPPLSSPTQAGRYGTTSVPGDPSSPNYGRYYQLHPGYDWRNWNWTLATDMPLAVNEKRVQAMLHLELAHPLISDLDKSFDFTLIISGAHLSSVQVNSKSVFFSPQDFVVRLKKPLFQNTATTEIGGVADSRKLVLGRRAPARGTMPADTGYDSNAPVSADSINMDLLSSFFTENRNNALAFSSGEITIKVYDTADVNAGTSATPLQTIRFQLPAGQAPLPDLVTTGSYWVNYVQPGGTLYNHPAVQAPRWWGFNRDGVLGRFQPGSGGPVDPDMNSNLRSVRGRFYGWDGISMTSELSARDPRFSSAADSQRLPGAKALIYGYDAQLYPDLKLVPEQALQSNPLLRIAYDPDTNYNRPIHYGTDTVRTISCIDQLEPRSTVTFDRFIPHPDYEDDEVHLAYGRGFDLPVITADPVSQTQGYGQPASFSVTSTGTTAPAYQWFLNNQPIQGATGRVYNIESTSAASGGDYHVVVTNAKGSVPSESARLTLEDVSITTPPASQTVTAGGNVSFTVVAAGTSLKYQWRRNGLNIPKATGATLNLSKVKPTDAGSYDVVVTGSFDSRISAAATLTVNVPLAILQHPLGGNLRTGSEFALQVQAVGMAPLSYQWRRGGQAIQDASEARLVLSGESALTGSYDVVVTDSSGSVTSKAAIVTVVSGPPVINGQPQTQVVQVGADVDFETVVIEMGVQYQWRKNGVNIPKANAGSLVLTNVQKKDEATYDCVVKNAYGATLSAQARLYVGDSLNFSFSPADMTVVSGETALFEAQVSGENVTYQWSFNGVPIPGAIYDTLSVPEADESKAGIYTITATKGTQKATTSALLKVLDKGALVYKLTGTGQTFAGTATQKVAFSGALIVQRGADGSQGALVLASKNGSQNVIQVQRFTDFRADSTGPAPKTQTVFSDISDNDNGTRSLFWMQGPDSLIVLGGPDKTLTAKTLSGNANRLEFDIFDGNPRVVVESIAFKGVLDIPGSLLSRRKAEDLNQAIERVSTDLLLKGYVEIPETAP